MAMKARKVAGWLNLVVASALALLGWILVAVLADRPDLKVLFDWSPQARFSVEKATVELLERIRSEGRKVEFHTIFYPLNYMRARTPEQRQQIADMQRLQELTRDLLRQYDYLGGDAVTVIHHDLVNNPGDVREVINALQKRRYNAVVVKLGSRSRLLSLEADLAEFDVPIGQGNQMPGARPAIRTLKSYKGEEAISTALKRLLVEGAPKVAFVEGYSGSVIADRFGRLIAALKDDGFEIDKLDLARQRDIPDDISVVALFDVQREISVADAEALVRYLRRGGRVFVNLSYTDVGPSYNPRLRVLGERLGFEIGQELVCHVIQDPEGGAPITGYPMVQNLVIANMNPAHPVTRPLLEAKRYPQLKAGREVRRLDKIPAGVRVDTRLLRTGPGAWLERWEPQRGGVDWRGPMERSAYAVRSVGAVIDVDNEEPDGRTGHLLLVAAAGFDNLGFAINGDLALNAFNWLARREALVGIHGKKYVPRSLVLTPQQLDRVFWLLVAGVPGALALLGIGVFWRRRRD